MFLRPNLIQGRKVESTALGRNEAFLKAVVKIGQFSLVPGLNIEAARMMSSLIRYSKDGEVLSLASSSNATSLMLGLLNSQHSQLLNESLVALCLITAPLPPGPKVVEQIDAEFTSTKIGDLLELDQAKCPREVKFNAITLVHNILKWNIDSVSSYFQNLASKLEPYKSDLEIVGDIQRMMLEGKLTKV